jgi:segregation and condensation protein A
MKAASLLPSVEDQEPVVEETHEDLVQRLLEYKQYKDAATMLEEQGRTWQQCYGRLASEAPTGRVDLADQPLQEVEVWDLVSAFGRIIRESRLVEEPPSIVYDDTPMQVYMQRIHGRLALHSRIAFHSIFEEGMHKSALIGSFLALLELVRHHDVAVEQPDLYGEIWIARGERFQPQLQLQLAELDWIDPPAPAKPR